MFANLSLQAIKNYILERTNGDEDEYLIDNCAKLIKFGINKIEYEDDDNFFERIGPSLSPDEYNWIFVPASACYDHRCSFCSRFFVQDYHSRYIYKETVVFTACPECNLNIHDLVDWHLCQLKAEINLHKFFLIQQFGKNGILIDDVVNTINYKTYYFSNYYTAACK